MNGRNYYLTTLGEWRRKAHRFAASHFVRVGFLGVAAQSEVGAEALDAASPVLVLAEGDEGVHNELLADNAWESLPHPLGNRAVASRVAVTLAAYGVREGATTYEAIELLAKAHPVMRYQVF